MQFSYDPKLKVLLEEIADIIVKKLPEEVARRRISEPAYALFMWYSDSSVFEYAPQFTICVDSMRQSLLERYADDHDHLFDLMWRPFQNNLEPLYPCDFEEVGFLEKCNETYRLMLAANKTDRPLADEGEILRPFRSMMHQVAMHLNSKDWSSIMPTTNDFVVVAAESIGYWDREDFKSSIPESKRPLLKGRIGEWLFE